MAKNKPNPLVNPDDYHPYGTFIMLEPEYEPEISEGGIFIPEQARHTLNEGKVLKVGPEVSKEITPGMFLTFGASSEYKLALAKDVVVFVIPETAIILTRKDKASKLFPTRVSLNTCEKHNFSSDDIPCPQCVEEYNHNVRARTHKIGTP